LRIEITYYKRYYFEEVHDCGWHGGGQRSEVGGRWSVVGGRWSEFDCSFRFPRHDDGPVTDQ
jgi:hypothetical protein